MCPAVYLTFGIIKSTFYEAAANRFINEQLGFENTQVLDKKVSYEHKEVRVVLIGSEVPDASISIARSKLKEYKLEDTKLIVLQGMNKRSGGCVFYPCHGNGRLLQEQRTTASGTKSQNNSTGDNSPTI